jgi:hypothetical protein
MPNFLLVTRLGTTDPLGALRYNPIVCSSVKVPDNRASPANQSLSIKLHLEDGSEFEGGRQLRCASRTARRIHRGA